MTTATLDRPAPTHAARRPPRAPRTRKPYEPKPWGPGTTITYSTDDGAKTGVVWSAGPVASSLWILPDDTPTNPVAVSIYRPRHGEPTAQQMNGYPPSWQRDTIRRCDAVRAAGRVFRCTETRVRAAWEYQGGTEQTSTVFPYHVEGCPVAGPDRQYEHGTGMFGPVAWVIDTLLHSGGSGQIAPQFCRVCIYLTGQG